MADATGLDEIKEALDGLWNKLEELPSAAQAEEIIEQLTTIAKALKALTTYIVDNEIGR